MRQMILLFSHALTKSQERDAKETWKVSQILQLPSGLQQTWSNINPDSQSVVSALEDIKVFTKTHLKKDDLVLVQGDFGATYHMVNYVKGLGGIALYATTRRSVYEVKTEEGKIVKQSIFEHRRFRRYE